MKVTESSRVKVSNAIGYAMLAVNIDSEKGSFLDYYSPMVIECIRVSEKEHVNPSDVSELMQATFYIRLPQHVIQAILRRLSRKKFLKYDSLSQVYKPNLEKIDRSTFKDKQTMILEKHASLVDGLQEFVNSRYLKLYLRDEIEEMFEDYLNISLKQMIDEIPLNQEQEKEFYMVASYIQELEMTHSPLFSYFESIFVGNMVATAVYFTEPDKYQQKFKNTKIYFDTTFIIYALGYADTVRQEPCVELMKILKEQHASLRCFQHTVDEIKDILHGCILKVESGTIDRWGTTAYLIKKKYRRSDILTIIHGIEEDIKKKLSLVIEEKPSYEPQIHNIGEAELGSFLKGNITYRNDNSLQRDIDSIHGIMRLRQSQKSTSVETCKALFVTTNNKLSKFTTQYFNKEDANSYVSPVISDYILTTIQWIKNPQVHPMLPKRRIVADCVAALQPPERVVKKYLEKIGELKESGELTDEKYYLLRTSESKQILMDKTLGDEEILLNIDYNELAELTKKKIGEEKDEIIHQQEVELEETQRVVKEKELEYQRLMKEKEREKEDILAEQDKKEANLKERIKKVSFVFHCFLATALTVLFLWGQHKGIEFLKQKELSFFENTIIKTFSYIIPAIGVWGFGIWPGMKTSHHKLQVSVYNWISK